VNGFRVLARNGLPPTCSRCAQSALLSSREDFTKKDPTGQSIENAVWTIPKEADEALEGAQRLSFSVDARHHDRAEALCRKFAIHRWRRFGLESADNRPPLGFMQGIGDVQSCGAHCRKDAAKQSKRTRQHDRGRSDEPGYCQRID
jgi:hypothetical protein